MNSAYIDWTPFVQDLVARNGKFNKILELGLGLGTKTLLESADMVYSVELLANPEHEGWIEQMKVEYKGWDNWKPYLFKCEDAYDNKIKFQVSAHITRIKPDLVFVDPGIHCRGDLVNLAMSKKVPMVMAHDTKCGDEEGKDLYGWKRINPEGYEVTRREEGQGTTLWTLIK